MYGNLLWKATLVLSLSIEGSSRLVTVPTINFTETTGVYPLNQLNKIIIDTRYADVVDHDGQTLVPPTLQQFAETFRDDLQSSLGLQLPIKSSSEPLSNSIFITLTNDSAFHDAAGRHTSEAYKLDVGENGITIAGASPLGAWWGTRSLIQVAVVTDRKLPRGSAVDAPGWANRGIMLDVGRHYYPPEFLLEMCSFLSFFKQNVFHVHLSDNLFRYKRYSPETTMNIYSAFRLWSEDEAVAGLNKRANESYTHEQFDHLQRQCARRGVTIIPEIEAPGHALVMVQWKPELGLTTDPTMLNISHPDTISTVESIWKTFLPWFHSKAVHIGADEYDKQLVADYTRFVNQLHSFIAHESGHTMRIWGTFTPRQGANVSTEVTIQHWETSYDNAYHDYIQNGYEVLNSDDAFYIVSKWSGVFPQQLNKTRIFHGNPAGGAFAPNIFDVKNASNNPGRVHANILGHVAALWNDWGPNSTTVLETYYAWRDLLPALADKQWGGDILEAEYDSVFNRLHVATPGQNLDRRIPSKSDTILHYLFDSDDDDDDDNGDGGFETVPDQSGNGYDGTVRGCDIRDAALVLSNGCYLETPLDSKGRDYSLSFTVKPTSSTPGVLFGGSDSMLMNGNGSISNVTLISGGNPYSLNYSLPLNTWTEVRLIGQGTRTFLTVGSNRMEFLAQIGIDGQRRVWAPVAIEAPLRRIGEGFTGMMKEISLRGQAE